MKTQTPLAPHSMETPRLVLRKPRLADAEGIFAAYASDPAVTRFLSWPTHRNIDHTRAFLQFCEAEWERFPAGPYLVEDRHSRTLLGSTGFAFETSSRASTGYVLRKDAWGKGYATEALLAVVTLAPTLGVRRLQALCHSDHEASQRVLEKCGFAQEARLKCYAGFPNWRPDEPSDVLMYAQMFGER